MLKREGSRSMKMAPDSSLKVEIRPDSRDVKNVSGTHVSVCLDVLNLVKEKRVWIIILPFLFSKNPNVYSFTFYSYLHY